MPWGPIIGWNGGECPVANDALVTCFLRGNVYPIVDWRAGALNWSQEGKSGDIIAYQVWEPKEYRIVRWWNPTHPDYLTHSSSIPPLSRKVTIFIAEGDDGEFTARAEIEGKLE